MKYNKYNAWTLALVSAGAVSLPAVAKADEHTNYVLTALSATTISGYVDTSMQWNPGTGNQNLPLYTPNGAASGTKADGFNLDAISLTISKPPGEGEWAAGYSATLLFGPDAVGFNTAPGVGTTTSDFSLVDTYVELRAPVGNGLDFKLGTFASPLGYEVYQTGNNPNYTRSYGYELEPTQLTGLIAAYQFCPALSAIAGVANTWSSGINNRANPPEAESYKTYLGSLTLTAPDSMGFLSGSTLTGGIVNGYNASVANGGAVETSFYAGATVKTPLKALSVGLAFDYACLGPNQAAGAGVVNNSGYQWAGAVYLVYQATDKLSFNTRADYLNQSSYLATTGLPGSSFALTESVQYDLWKNVLTRAEFRWDHACNGTYPWGAPTGPLENEFMLALNVIYKF
jgi:predicted porin